MAISLKTIKRLLPRTILRAYPRVSCHERHARLHDIDLYLAKGRVPFSRGFETYLNDFVERALNVEGILACFRESRALPESFGFGLHERCIEYPWVFSRLADAGVGPLLDVGSTLNHSHMIGSPQLAGREICILTLAPEGHSFYSQRISYVFGDARRLPFKDKWFGTVICISTLEHIGMDNDVYTGKAWRAAGKPEDFETAVREFKRVFKPVGNLFITVSYGRPQHFARSQIFGLSHIARLLKAFKPIRVESYYYSSSASWRHSRPDACKNADYVKWCMLPLDGRSPFPIREDRVAAAQAVGCIHFVK